MFEEKIRREGNGIVGKDGFFWWELRVDLVFGKKENGKGGKEKVSRKRGEKIKINKESETKGGNFGSDINVEGNTYK